MIDWHSHILPLIDDGSRNVAESVLMLEMQKSQGVSTVIATPHFYANDEDVDSFLERQKGAYELLKAELPEGLPKIKLGAEVAYYQGISRMEGLDALKIEGSKLLLLEMPMARWTEYMVRELIELSAKGSIQIVLAHIERYLHLQNKKTMDRIYDGGILMQVNASFFTKFASKGKALSLLRQEKIHFVGSDSHNSVSRPPQIGKAFEVIQKKLGNDYISQMNEYGYSMFTTTNK